MTRSTVVVTGVGLTVSGLPANADLLAADTLDPTAEPNLGGRRLRHKDRASRLALCAVERALIDAGLPTDPVETAGTTATVVSSNHGNLDSVCDFTDRIAEQSTAALSPLGLPHVSSNAIAGWIAIRHRLHGPNITLCSGRTGGLDALHWAATLIRAGRADTAVVVGVEPDTEPVRGLLGIGPEQPILDGAAALILETAAHARNRRAIVRAVVGNCFRTDTLDSLAAALRVASPAPGLWLTSAGLSSEIESPIPATDPARRFGECSGALGVLQSAAAVAHFDRGEPRPVYATCARPDGDAVTLRLYPPDAAGCHPVHEHAGAPELEES
ncbi:beta-ketoacyl synthase N-terminal-like domain-containing protein [Nocardia sp. BMG111209]|uniref:beta-ketoacyl synthase N-terminal-like domain-containing protein n=1 Tax=Nocardia sp. BMG111209 TaxID=1160137 RepID=UPI000366AD96|nr:beta-ketoacyl synthase N-terminal-like domain-containing protein [Nocardia sp. BMG111209]